MEHKAERPPIRRKHLLTDQQLAPHSGASAEDMVEVHHHGNGVRIHRTYIIVVSLVALFLLGAAVAMASASM